MRNKRGRGVEWANPKKGAPTPVPPLHSIASPWQPLRYWRGLQFKGLGSTSSGSFVGDPLSPLDWAVYLAADWPRPGVALGRGGIKGQKYQGRRVQDGSGLLG